MLDLDDAINEFVAAVLAFVEAILNFALAPLIWIFGLDIDLTPK